LYTVTSLLSIILVLITFALAASLGVALYVDASNEVQIKLGLSVGMTAAGTVFILMLRTAYQVDELWKEYKKNAGTN
jgi:TRAP-type C4-dicarboxylate transport system permease small subunit